MGGDVVSSGDVQKTSEVAHCIEQIGLAATVVSNVTRCPEVDV
jgi:hypothetical protein